MDLKSKLDDLAPGIGIVGITGLAALFLSEHYATPVMLFALLLGIAVSFLYDETRCRNGIDFTTTSLLRIGVALIGLRITLRDLFDLGWQTGLLLVFAIASTILFGLFVCRALKMPSSFGALSGGAVGICGASAALAISSVLPNYKERERDTLMTVIGVTLLSTIAMIAYPILAHWLGFNTQETSLFLGGTIHDVAQVVGAGYSVSNETGDMATLTKLVRVSMLVPVVIIFIVIFNQKLGANYNEKPVLLPLFLIAFIALMVINSTLAIPDSITSFAGQCSRFALVMAMAGIGMKSNLRQLLEVGMKPIVILVAETIWIAMLFIVAIKLL